MTGRGAAVAVAVSVNVSIRVRLRVSVNESLDGRVRRGQRVRRDMKRRDALMPAATSGRVSSA